VAERIDLLRTLYEAARDLLEQLDVRGVALVETRSRVSRALAAIEQYDTPAAGTRTLCLRLPSGETIGIPDDAKVILDRHARGLPDVVVSPARVSSLIESAGPET